MTYLTEAELEAIQHLDRSAPYCIQDVSNGIFSVSRHYGCCTFQGAYYVYSKTHDELIRDDVLQFVTKARRQARRDELAAEQAREGELDL